MKPIVKSFLISGIALPALLGFGLLRATPMNGGRGLLYVHSASTLEKGRLELFSGVRYFGKIASFGGSQRAYMLWDVQNSLSINYGAGPHVELSLAPILYQDINGQGGNFWDGQANFPDDILASVKFGSYRSLESPWVWGGLVTLRLPTAKVHNVIYEPYSAGNVSVQLTALASYHRNALFPDAGWSCHANLGYLNHNDVGRSLSRVPDAPSAQRMSSEFLAGAGFLLPSDQFSFSAEINGRAFLTRPPDPAYSREYASYLTLGVAYRFTPWVSAEMGFDKSLLMGEDLTDYRYVKPKEKGFPNYPSWRGLLGVRLAVLPRSLYRSEKSGLEQTAKDRQAILERMIESQSDMESAEQELARIQAERKKVEEELERLRLLLESEKKSQPESDRP
ncbi:MAG: hypothetical protein QUS35_00790 [bacterium]|nr:hypothetical protein [bacterium]